MLMASVEASALASADVIETSSPGANVYVNEEHDGAFVQSILTQKGSRANNTHISKSIVFSSDEVESDGASSSNNAILLAENKNINDSCVVNLSNGITLKQISKYILILF